MSVPGTNDHQGTEGGKKGEGWKEEAKGKIEVRERGEEEIGRAHV